MISTIALPLVLAATVLRSSDDENSSTTEWVHGPLDQALAKAQAKDQWVLIYFWMEDSEFCQRLYGDTLLQEKAVAEMQNFVCLNAPITEPEGNQLLKQFGVSTIPSLLFLSANGQVQDAVPGYVDLAEFLDQTRRILSDTGTVGSYRRAVEQAPEDLNRRLDLASKLDFVGANAEGDSLRQSIREIDPRGDTEAGARLLLGDALTAVREAAPDPSDPSTFDLEGLKRELESLRHGSVQFEAWQWIADVALQKGNRVEEKEALREAWRCVPEARRAFWGQFLVKRHWEMRRELTEKERKLTLSVAEAVSKEARSVLKQNPSANVPLALVLQRLAMAYSLNRKSSQAKKAIAEALELEPENLSHQQLRDTIQAESR